MTGMSQISMIFVWIGAGLALRRWALPPAAFTRLNRFIVWLPLPATILLALHALRWEPSFWIPISMAWIVFLAAVALFSAAGRLCGWSSGTVGALILTAGLGNTSFLGFPLLRALYGEGAIPVAVLTDQPGSFLVLSTLGIFTASFYSARRASVIGRMARFPPLWALIAAVILRPLPLPAQGFLRLSARLLIPLALVSVGGALSFDRTHLHRERSALAWGLVYKLLAAPAALLLLYVVILGHRGEAVRITVLEAAMGPMITGSIVAIEYGLNPELCSLIVGAGVPLCLLTVPLWSALLNALPLR